jgi:hypothetical protein
MEAGSCFMVPWVDELAIEADVVRFTDDVDRERHGRLDRRAKLTYAGRTATIERGSCAPVPRSTSEVNGLEAREPGRVTALHFRKEPSSLRELGVGAEQRFGMRERALGTVGVVLREQLAGEVETLLHTRRHHSVDWNRVTPGLAGQYEPKPTRGSPRLEDVRNRVGGSVDPNGDGVHLRS